MDTTVDIRPRRRDEARVVSPSTPRYICVSSQLRPVLNLSLSSSLIRKRSYDIFWNQNHSSIVGHPGLAAYVAIAENECIARTKFEMVEVSLLMPDIVQIGPTADQVSSV
jgi:hypothetical protein